jgi:DNA-binding MarR family transcriptional regulator
MVHQQALVRGGPARARPVVSELESHLGYWLRFVSNHVSHRFQSQVEAAGVSLSEWVVLRQLYGGACASPSELAAAIGMTKGAISKIVTRLVDKQLLTRVVSTDDRRQQALLLTRKGEALVPTLAGLADANDAEFFGHLSKAARAELLETLRALVHHHHLESIPVD